MKRLSIFALLILVGCAPKQAAKPSVAVAPRAAIASPVVAATPVCPNLPPVCAGGLISQDATPDKINAYMTKYRLTVPLTCRFQQPPKCFTGEKPVCKTECTP